MANHTNWLNISSMRGSSGQTILTLTASTNYESTERLATIKAYNPVYGVSATTSVRMSAYSPYIQVNPGMVGVPGSGGTYQFSISSNCSYVIVYPDLVSSYSASAGTGNTNITFTVPSTSADTTLVGNIVLTDTSGQYSTILRVEQYGSGVSITFSPSAVTIPFSGGSATFTVTANCVYSVNKGSETWYSVSPQSGYTGQTVFTISSTTVNTGDTAWTSSIDIVGPSGSVGTVSVTEEAEGSTRINYTADTSTIAASGDTRIITIDATDFINSSITVTVVDAPEGVTAVYTQSSTTRGLITLTVPDNPGSPRNITVVVTGRRALSTTIASATIVFPQAAHSIVPIAYTADTSTVDASGETRTITIDTTNLVASSITIGIEGATGVSYSYDNGVIIMTIPANRTRDDREITVTVSGVTTIGDSAIAEILYEQETAATYQIPYTADTSYVDVTGETRYIYIDTEELVTSSITVTSYGAAGLITSYDNGVITVVFPNNSGAEVDFFDWTIEITGDAINGDIAYASVEYSQITVDAETVPLSFKVLSDGYIYWTQTNTITVDTKEIQYSLNGGPWVTIRSSVIPDGGPKIYVAPGDILRFKGLNSTYGSGSYGGAFFSRSTAKYDIYGNILSMTFGDDFSGHTECGGYPKLFLREPIRSAEKLILNTTAANCYENMFSGCTSLTTAPELPATTLANGCYGGMFQGCMSLTTAPALPATTLRDGCYHMMFYGCTSLTTAPELPATAMKSYCYQNMFGGCTSLTTAPELPATTLALNCYYNMFQGCTSLISAPELPAFAMASSCYGYMFNGCSALTAAPALPATILADGCYDSMFRGCTSLTTGPALLVTQLVNNCYKQMFQGCSNLNYIKCYATDISASSCTYNWVDGVASAGTFVKDGSMTGWTIGLSGIPNGWIVKDYDLNLSSPFVTLSEIASAKTVTVTSSFNNWTATTNDNWYGLSQYTGGTGVTIITITANTQDTNRTGKVTFTDGTNVAELTVKERYLVGTPVTFTVISAGTIEWNTTASPLIKTIKYKKNDDEWKSITSSGGASIPVSEDDVIQFKGDNNAYSDGSKYSYFGGSTAKFEVEGNIMSLINSTGYTTATTLASFYTFHKLFAGCIGLTSAENLVLPATALTRYCYQNMFNGCTSLTTAPSILPATTLTEECYWGMFAGCRSLTTAPELPATTLVYWCYYGMFNGCTSLTTAPSILPATALTPSCYRDMFFGCTSLTSAPELPATTLANYCYYRMFYNCTSLNYIKCLATDISASSCTTDWVSGVSSAGTFVKDANMTRWTTGVSGIPVNWVVEDYIPTYEDEYLTFNILTGGTIVWEAQDTAYTTTIEYSTDNGETWTSITSNIGASTPSISVSAGDTVQFRGDNATYSSGISRYNTFSGSTAKFEVEGNIMSLIDSTGFTTATTLASRYTFNRLFYMCTGLTSAENLVLPATALTDGCYDMMFAYCRLTTAPELPATTLANYCYDSMFWGCTSLTTAPELPATTLASQCYQSMFYACTSLTTAPELPATTLTYACYESMFRGCTSLTTAPELPATTLADYCYYRMFYNCTSLNYIKCLATDISAGGCTADWVDGVSSTGTFVKDANMEDWTTGASGIPTNWTVQDAT